MGVRCELSRVRPSEEMSFFHRQTGSSAAVEHGAFVSDTVSHLTHMPGDACNDS